MKMTQNTLPTATAEEILRFLNQPQPGNRIAIHYDWEVNAESKRQHAAILIINPTAGSSTSTAELLERSASPSPFHCAVSTLILC